MVFAHLWRTVERSKSSGSLTAVRSVQRPGWSCEASALLSHDPPEIWEDLENDTAVLRTHPVVWYYAARGSMTRLRALAPIHSKIARLKAVHMHMEFHGIPFGLPNRRSLHFDALYGNVVLCQLVWGSRTVSFVRGEDELNLVFSS